MRVRHRTYKFNNPMDMAELAREIQTKVYWDNVFYLDKDGVDTVRYSEFWEYVINGLDNGNVSVTIYDDDLVIFI